MNRAIPLGPKGEPPIAATEYYRTNDIEEAAALLSEEGCAPYPDKANFIRHLRHGKKGKPYHEFRFRGCAEQRLVMQAFHRRDRFLAEHPDHPFAFVVQCFDARRELARQLLPHWPEFNPAFAGFVTRNLKEAATILATDAGQPQPTATDFIRRDISRGRPGFYVFQFEHTPAVHAIHDAFAAPEPFVAAHRDHWLAYVVRAFYLREVLCQRIHDPENPLPILRLERLQKNGSTAIKAIPERSPAP